MTLRFWCMNWSRFAMPFPSTVNLVHYRTPKPFCACCPGVNSNIFTTSYLEILLNTAFCLNLGFTSTLAKGKHSSFYFYFFFNGLLRVKRLRPACMNSVAASIASRKQTKAMRFSQRCTALFSDRTVVMLGIGKRTIAIGN